MTIGSKFSSFVLTQFFSLSLEIDRDIFEKRLGTFYRFTKDEQFVPLKSSVGISNGLAWNEKTNKFYYIDSVDLDVKEFDYDPVTGNLSMCLSFAFRQRQHEIFIQIFFFLQQMSVLSSTLLLTVNVQILCLTV